MKIGILVNFVAFQIGWFACVLGGAHDWPWLGTLTAVVVIGLHLYQAQRPQTEVLLIVLTGIIGLILDSVPVFLGWLVYPSGVLIEGLAPHWIVAMWMMFATTLNVTFTWLKGKFWLAAVLGVVAGPMAYYGGAKLGGLEFIDLTAALIALGINWGIAMPLLIMLSDRYDGMAETSRGSDVHDVSAITKRSE